MTTQLFLTLLLGFSLITGLVVEGIKQIRNDKEQLPNNIIALCVALIVGVGGMFTYYQLANVEITINNVIYAILMGLASSLVSMNGFDKVKQAIEQLVSK